MRVGRHDLDFCEIEVLDGKYCDIQGRELTETEEVVNLTPWPADQCRVYNVCEGVDVLVPRINERAWL